MRFTQATERAAKKWMVEALKLQGNEPCWGKVFDLAEPAFMLYARDWGRPATGWRWPFDEVARADGGESFNDGSEPWTVLLREAYGIARTALGWTSFECGGPMKPPEVKA